MNLNLQRNVFAQNLGSLLKRLLENQIGFILAGGFASVVHGANLVTKDLDICLFMSEVQIEKLKLALNDLHPIRRMNPTFSPSFLDQSLHLTRLKNIDLRTDWGVLDILSELPPIGDRPPFVE